MANHNTANQVLANKRTAMQNINVNCCHYTLQCCNICTNIFLHV